MQHFMTVGWVPCALCLVHGRYQVSRGATTLWEDWSGTADVSRVHTG